MVNIWGSERKGIKRKEELRKRGKRWDRKNGEQNKEGWLEEGKRRKEEVIKMPEKGKNKEEGNEGVRGGEGKNKGERKKFKV